MIIQSLLLKQNIQNILSLFFQASKIKFWSLHFPYNTPSQLFSTSGFERWYFNRNCIIFTPLILLLQYTIDTVIVP